MSRTILHCDMNNFYASVECMNNPELRNKPVAVCGEVEERHGIVLAKNYVAKAFGVSTGEAIWQAKQKCKDLVIVHPHYDEYMKFSRLAREIYGRYTDLIEPFGMDECWLDVTGSTHLYGDGETIANQIRETIKLELGLTISVGVSFNKIFAKLGSDMKKPDAVTVISEDGFREKIWGLPASDMLGVGRATERSLTSCGILTLGDLARWPVDFFHHRFGKRGVDLWRWANGLDTSPVTVRNIEALDKSCGNGITTLQDLEAPEEVWKVMLELSQEVGHRLFLYNKRAAAIAIDIRDSELFTKQWQCGIPLVTQSPGEIARQAFGLFMRSYRWKNPIRSVTVRAIDLVSADAPRQVNMFIDAEKESRTEAIDRCVEEIRSRFGKYSIRYATLLDNPKMPQHGGPDIIMPSGIPMG